MAGRERPNVVLIVLDTVRAQHLELYGHESPTMPSLSRFTEDATLFERAYTNAPWTLPAHASLFTGRLPSEHGCHGGSLTFDPDGKPLAEQLSMVGYATRAISNNIWVSDHFGFDRGFDRFYKQWQLFRQATDIGHIMKTDSLPREVFSEILSGNPIVNVVNGLYGKWVYRRSDFGGARTTGDAIDQLRELESPFFLFLNYMEAHAPYQVHEETGAFLDDTHDIDRLTELSGRSMDFHLGNLDISEEEFERMRSLYDGELRYLDEQLARLFEALREYELLEESMVVIVGDHGENIGDHGLMAHRFSVHDTLLRIPMIIHYPDGRTSAVDPSDPVDLRVLYHEILRTCGNEAGVPTRVQDGPVVAEYIDPSYTPEANNDMFEFENSEFNRRYAAAITRDHKLVRDGDGAAVLYKRDGGDFEMDGRTIKNQKLERELASASPDPREWADQREPQQIDEAVLDHLNTLGYR